MGQPEIRKTKFGFPNLKNIKKITEINNKFKVTFLEIPFYN